jgi:hypothetical protein
MNGPVVKGKPPEITGSPCEELICQQSWYNGKLVDEANVIYLKFQGSWHMLFFDCSIISWGKEEEGPMEVGATEEGFSCPLVDLGREFKLKGQVLKSYSAETIDGGCQVSFLFDNGTNLVFKNESGFNTYAAS